MTTASGPRVAELVIAADPAPWRDAGFEVEGELLRIGTVSIRLAGADTGRRIVSMALRGAEGDFDGLPVIDATGVGVDGAGVEGGTTAATDGAPSAHPNGAIQIDHVVAISPDLDRTVAALEETGLDLRRRREGPTPGGSVRQAFFRLGEVILEVVEMPRDAPGGPPPSADARFFGLAFVVEDIDRAAERLGEMLGSVRGAVQPGRRIATFRREAGLGLPVAVMSPGPGAV